MNGAIVLCVWTQRDGEMSGRRDEKCKHFSDFQGGGGGWVAGGSGNPKAITM